MKSNLKIKVLQIITLFSIGGATETVISIASGLKNKFLEVDIITGPNVELEGDMYTEASRLGLNVLTFSTLKREIHFFDDLITFFKLYIFIRRGGYTLIHTHSSKAGILGRWAAWLAGVKNIVHTVHGWGFNESQNRMLKSAIIFTERITALITNKIVCVTILDIEKGIANKIGIRDQYCVIRSGIDIGKYSNLSITKIIAKNRLKIDESEYVIGSVTRFASQKAPMDTILGFNQIIKKGFVNSRLIMVGDGPLLEESKTLAKKLELNNKIIFTGIRNDIPEILKAFDVFILSSLWEGLPRVILQAIASGVPVIATDIDGNSEIIVDGITGILVKPNDPHQISSKIIELIENLEESNKLVKNAKQVLIEYDEVKMINDTFNLYNQIVFN